jgi:hypothetical protein
MANLGRWHLHLATASVFVVQLTSTASVRGNSKKFTCTEAIDLVLESSTADGQPQPVEPGTRAKVNGVLVPDGREYLKGVRLFGAGEKESGHYVLAP